RPDPFRKASKLVGRPRCVNQEATKVIARVKRIAGVLGVPSRSTLGEGHVDIAALELIDARTPRGRRGWHARTEWSAKARITTLSPWRCKYFLGFEGKHANRQAPRVNDLLIPAQAAH